MNPALAKLNRWQRPALALGVAGVVAAGIGAAFRPDDFFISYLWAFLFWIGLSFGCLNLALIHYLTGGSWGNATRRFFEAGYLTLPLMAVLFLPILFGLHELYPWARPDEVAHDKILRHRESYENFWCFIGRSVFFFAVWILFASRLRKWSLRQDRTGDVEPTLRLRALSGPAVFIVPLTITFALIDWMMTIEPAWYSTIFAVILLAGQLLAAISFSILVLAGFRKHPPFAAVTDTKQFHDLGNLLLAFVMFWTYVAFAQVLIIYATNEPHEIGWYLRRIDGGWRYLAGAIALFHFFVPFLLLLFRPISKSITRIAVIAGLVFTTHVLEIFWAVAPTFYRNGFTVHWTDLAAWVGIGGLWLGFFCGNLRRHPLLANTDPAHQPSAPQPAHAG